MFIEIFMPGETGFSRGILWLNGNRARKQALLFEDRVQVCTDGVESESMQWHKAKVCFSM